MTAKNGGDAFAALGLERKLIAVLRELGYEEPTPVQKRAIPVLLQGRDLVAQAATGTGKTAAFALPLLQRLFAEGADRRAVTVLVLVPTRELAMQVAEAPGSASCRSTAARPSTLSCARCAAAWTSWWPLPGGRVTISGAAPSS
jgi:superfamily II DNA/RNA helicase